MIPVDTIWLLSLLLHGSPLPSSCTPTVCMYITFHAETLSVKNGEAKQSRIIHGSEYINRLVRTGFDIRMQPRLSILYTQYYSGHIIASYCFQSLIGLASFLSAMYIL